MPWFNDPDNKVHFASQRVVLICGVRGIDCGVRGIDCGVRDVDYGVRAVVCGVRDMTCRMRDEFPGTKQTENKEDNSI